MYENMDRNIAGCRPHPTPQPTPCPKPCGTVLQICIPAGAVIRILNLFEISSPTGINLVVRIPFLCGRAGLATIIDTVKSAGGSVEVLD
jgi:hypothetical protein